MVSNQNSWFTNNTNNAPEVNIDREYSLGPIEK